MRKALIFIILLTFLSAGVGTVSAMTVFDPINHATSLLRNTILEAQHLENMLEAGKRLLELKNLFKEFEFFNHELIRSGFGDIGNIIQKLKFWVTDSGEVTLPFKDAVSDTFLETLRRNPYYEGTPSQTALVQFLSSRAESGAATLPYYLTLVPDPLSPNHEYITYEQAEIANTFDQAEALRNYAGELQKDGEKLEDAASEANLLGAARLEAASMGKLFEAFGVLLSAQGRLAELSALSLEQTSRDEKLDELARRKVFQDLNEFVYGAGAFSVEVNL